MHLRMYGCCSHKKRTKVQRQCLRKPEKSKIQSTVLLQTYFEKLSHKRHKFDYLGSKKAASTKMSFPYKIVKQFKKYWKNVLL